MQAASLFAFGEYKGCATGLLAHVTNAVHHDGEPFDKEPEDADVQLMEAITTVRTVF